MNQLVIKVDGNQVDSQYVANVYRQAHGRKPYVEMYLLDDKGMIEELEGQPVTYEVEGEITIDGTPRTCGCWRGKKVKNWWHKLNDKRPGW